MSRLILLPGLGADERMFSNLGAAELPLVTPRHLVPVRGEDLPAYARRTAEHLGIGADDVVGGASFGSLVASAIARQRSVRALVLIGGALSAAGLRQVPGSRLILLLPVVLVRPLLRSERVLKLVFAPESAEMRQLAGKMLAEAPDDLLLYGGRMLCRYRTDEKVPCPVFAIHGGRDPVMNPPLAPGLRLLPEAGHGIAWTHGPEVGTFLREAWAASVRSPADATKREAAGRPVRK